MPQKPDKRTVTRSVIDSAVGPSAIYKWPDVESEFAKQLLDQLISLLTPLGLHRLRASQSPRRAKRRKVTVTGPIVEKPELVKQIENACRIGFNACTNHLTRQACHVRDPSMYPDSNTHAHNPLELIKTLFVCREDLGPSDILPSLLYDHLPGLTHSASSSSSASSSLSQADTDSVISVRIVQLPKGSEALLGKSLALPRVTMLALLDSDLEPIKSINRHVETHILPAASSFPIPRASEYQALRIKTIHTSAPPLASRKKTAFVVPVDIKTKASDGQQVST